MKYYRISLKKFYEGEMISPSVEGDKIPRSAKSHDFAEQPKAKSQNISKKKI